ncbi:hypothetical protein DFJ77DRAFT_457764 [Powellomyces hirtus]|nr:hypothetical protein DFJ77DRAFT_457764 [Powellomyces hirtus]
MDPELKNQVSNAQRIRQSTTSMMKPKATVAKNQVPTHEALAAHILNRIHAHAHISILDGAFQDSVIIDKLRDDAQGAIAYTVQFAPVKQQPRYEKFDWLPTSTVGYQEILLDTFKRRQQCLMITNPQPLAQFLQTILVRPKHAFDKCAKEKIIVVRDFSPTKCVPPTASQPLFHEPCLIRCLTANNNLKYVSPCLMDVENIIWAYKCVPGKKTPAGKLSTKYEFEMVPTDAVKKAYGIMQGMENERFL